MKLWAVVFFLFVIGAFPLENIWAHEELNPLEVLNIYPDATPEEVKAAFKKMVKATHPDVNPQASREDFLKVKDAFDLLKARNFDLSGFKREKPSTRSRSQTYFDVQTMAASKPILFLNEFLRTSGLLSLDLHSLKQQVKSYFEEALARRSSDVSLVQATAGIFEDVLSQEREIMEKSGGNLLVVEASLLSAFEILKEARGADEVRYRELHRQGVSFLESRARQAKNYTEEQWYESISFQVESPCGDLLRN